MINFKTLNGIEGKTGVLIVNLGTPDEAKRGAVYRYLRQFLMDKRVIDVNVVARAVLVEGIIAPFRSGASAKGYQKLWTENGSPLKYHGNALVNKLKARLPAEYEVVLAMRYQNPSIEAAINELVQKQVARIIVFPLFPQYASASTGSAHEEVMRVLSQKQVIPDVYFLNSYSAYEPMIKLYAEHGRKCGLDNYDHILFSFHGIPQRQMRKADSTGKHCLKVPNCCENLCTDNQYCYSAQCHKTAQQIVKELGLTKDRYSICYQSRLGYDPWMKPYTVDTIKELAQRGIKKMLVFCPAFTSDCLETTVEISDEYAEKFEEWGGESMDLVPSLNADDAWADVVTEMIQKL